MSKNTGYKSVNLNKVDRLLTYISRGNHYPHYHCPSYDTQKRRGMSSILCAYWRPKPDELTNARRRGNPNAER